MTNRMTNQPHHDAEAPREAPSGHAPGQDPTAKPPAPDGAASAPSDASGDAFEQLTADIVVAVKTVYDPEIPVDIYELGLIYRIDVGDDRAITIDLTLTTPNCPSAQELPSMVENAAASVPGVGPVTVNVVWDPPWDPSRMSDEARAALNMW